jgi:hypothetical protein
MNIKFSRGTATLDSATMPAEMLQALDAKKPDDVFFIRSATSASYFKVLSVDAKPLAGEDADQFAKREVRAEIGRNGARQITDAALANAKYEGDYARVMALPTPGAASPAPAAGGEPPAGAAPAAGGEPPVAGGEPPAGAGQTTEKPADDSQKEQPKN